jgi:hypothetical protein
VEGWGMLGATLSDDDPPQEVPCGNAVWFVLLQLWTRLGGGRYERGYARTAGQGRVGHTCTSSTVVMHILAHYTSAFQSSVWPHGPIDVVLFGRWLFKVHALAVPCCTARKPLGNNSCWVIGQVP